MKWIMVNSPRGPMKVHDDSWEAGQARLGSGGYSLIASENTSDKGEAPASPDSDPPARRRRKVRKHVAKDQG